MRTILILSLVALMNLSLSAQNTTPDPVLAQHFSQEQLDKMTEGRIAYWNFYVDNAYSIQEIPTEKYEALVAQLEVIEVSSTDFDAFTVDLMEYTSNGAMLRFAGENKMLVIRSLDRINKEFNTHYQKTLNQ